MSGPAPVREPARRIIGNLDCEVDFARAEAALRAARGEPAPGPRDPRFALPPRVAAAISGLATLLRAFAREGDVLWTPIAVDPARLAPVRGLPLLPLATGPLERFPPAGGVLAWGETAAVEAERARSRGAPHPRGDGDPPGLAGSLFGVEPPPAAVAARVNHRSFAHGLAATLGLALPGARLISSAGDLDGHLRAGGAAAGSEERWVLKSPHSAAGRSRVRGQGRELSPSQRSGAERLLELHGDLLFEPWVERTEDFGFSAVLEKGGLRLLGLHRLEVDAGGGFRGIEIGTEAAAERWLSDEERLALEKTASHAAESLGEAGYRGQFGIDCYRWRDGEGRPRFQPLGEINARLTFGLVARALRERLLATGKLDAGAGTRLRLGKGRELGARMRADARTVPLLLPSAADPGAAWLEPSSVLAGGE